ncbi:Uu.00g043280.m01.CDS01 [Anthostomella pinea]|uniref:Uu.00g043280.m01.CDS01 n=1 Tax=Anthostomella pinea TaxID=933095 RepID=A0AAI8VBP3_9PEZI|nr:Uu.00g043280.m01.CDS01 [Anthostomella pinea]
MADTATKVYEIVVLGGNFGGLGATHYLLRHTIPSLQRTNKGSLFHITLVSPNRQAYFKIGSPRTLVQPNLLPEARLWKPLSEAFAQYPSDQVTVVQAVATGLSSHERTVTVTHRGPDASVASESMIPYDALLIATGTTAPSPLWTLHEDESLTSREFEAVQKALPTAKTILVAGGGPVGIETAGELASAYPSAEITLLSGGSGLLPRVRSKIGARAQSYLQDHFGVNVVHDLRVSSTSAGGPGTGPTEVTLSDGTTRPVDLYIDATGGVPNSQFLPPGWLDVTGRINTRDAHFRVQGDAGDGVYVLGDIVAGSNNTLFDLDAMVPTVCSAVAVDLAALLSPGAQPASRPGLLGIFFGGGGSASGVPAEKEFSPMRDTMLVPMGTGGGVGMVMGWQVPSWFVRMVKSKSYLIDMFDPVVAGSKWGKA